MSSEPSDATSPFGSPPGPLELAPRPESFSSAFQPIFSLSHGRLVGHEALLRVQETRTGLHIAPNVYLEQLVAPLARAQSDLAALRLHLRNYRAQGKADVPEWLFLNMHPQTLLCEGIDFAEIVQSLEAGAINPTRVVIEVLESAHNGGRLLDERLMALRDRGCLIALDDFGAGHSNFERVFDLKPHIVKLDRHVLLRAEASVQARRIVQQMVSLLHECGALVLMEGIETLQGAHIALTCDVDFVQGYFFSRPNSAVRLAAADCDPLREAWDTFDSVSAVADDKWRDSMASHCELLRAAAFEVSRGAACESACAAFLGAPGAIMCFELDEQGRQVGKLVFASDAARSELGGAPQFEPLRNCDGARWSRRQYFRRALTYKGQVQLTRPYLTLQGGRLCLTASIAFDLPCGKVGILCGDIALTENRKSA